MPGKITRPNINKAARFAIINGYISDEKALNKALLTENITQGQLKINFMLKAAYESTGTPLIEAVMLVGHEKDALELTRTLMVQSLSLSANERKWVQTNCLPRALFIAVALDYRDVIDTLMRYNTSNHQTNLDVNTTNFLGENIIDQAARLRRWHALQPFKRQLTKKYFRPKKDIEHAARYVAVTQNDPRFLLLAKELGVILEDKRGTFLSPNRDAHEFLCLHHDTCEDAHRVIHQTEPLSDTDREAMFQRHDLLDEYLTLTYNGQLIKAQHIDRIIELFDNENFPINSLALDNFHLLITLNNSLKEDLSAQDMRRIVDAFLAHIKLESLSIASQINTLIHLVNLTLSPELSQLLEETQWLQRILKQINEADGVQITNLMTILLNHPVTPLKEQLFGLVQHPDYHAFKSSIIASINQPKVMDAYCPLLASINLSISLDELIQRYHEDNFLYRFFICFFLRTLNDRSKNSLATMLLELIKQGHWKIYDALTFEMLKSDYKTAGLDAWILQRSLRFIAENQLFFAEKEDKDVFLKNKDAVAQLKIAFQSLIAANENVFLIHDKTGSSVVRLLLHHPYLVEIDSQDCVINYLIKAINVFKQRGEPVTESIKHDLRAIIDFVFHIDISSGFSVKFINVRPLIAVIFKICPDLLSDNPARWLQTILMHPQDLDEELIEKTDLREYLGVKAMVLKQVLVSLPAQIDACKCYVNGGENPASLFDALANDQFLTKKQLHDIFAHLTNIELALETLNQEEFPGVPSIWAAAVSCLNIPFLEILSENYLYTLDEEQLETLIDKCAAEVLGRVDCNRFDDVQQRLKSLREVITDNALPTTFKAAC